jgi:hypothetical protein
MQPIVSLSVTEAELVAATECAQDLIYEKNILELIGLKVELPIKLYIHNSGCIDLICNWSSGGRTHHLETCMFWLCELKEEEPLIIHPHHFQAQKRQKWCCSHLQSPSFHHPN